MFDYAITESMLPYVQCPNCNLRIRFHGGYYPKEIICQNCGEEINLGQALKNLRYPNLKYDKEGHLLKEVSKNE